MELMRPVNCEYAVTMFAICVAEAPGKLAGLLNGLFDFADAPRAGRQLILDPTSGGVVTSK